MTLISFIASHKAFKHSQNIAYQYYIEEKREAEDANSILGLFTRYLTYTAGLFFMGALVMTFLFAVANVSNLSAILKSSKSGGVTVTDKAFPVTTGYDGQKGVEPARVIRVPPAPLIVVPPAPAPRIPGRQHR